MKKLNWPLHLLAIAILMAGMVCTSPLLAHQIRGTNDNPTHRHVYKQNDFGQGATEGHYAKPAGSNGIVIWQAAPRRSYGRPQPGFKIPDVQSQQPSQKQMYQQEPVFKKQKTPPPDFNR